MPRITELFAFVIADSDEDDEGVPAFMNTEGAWMPLIGADMERIHGLMWMVQEMSNSSGKQIRLVRSTGLEVVDVIHPASKYAGGGTDG